MCPVRCVTYVSGRSRLSPLSDQGSLSSPDNSRFWVSSMANAAAGENTLTIRNCHCLYGTGHKHRLCICDLGEGPRTSWRQAFFHLTEGRLTA